MIYEMKLIEDEFNNIKYNGKIIEVRVNDSKRKLIHKDDVIKFKNLSNEEEFIFVIVRELYLYSNFQEVYRDIPISYFGYRDIEIDNILENIYKIYTKEEEETMGVVAIKFNILNNSYLK